MPPQPHEHFLFLSTHRPVNNRVFSRELEWPMLTSFLYVGSIHSVLLYLHYVDNIQDVPGGM